MRLQGNLPENLPADALGVFARYKLSLPKDRKLIIEIRRQTHAD